MTHERAPKKAKGHEAPTEHQDDKSTSLNKNLTPECFAGKTSTATSKPETASTKPESITKVYPSRSHGVGLWNNRRVPWTVRVDEGLKNAFVPIVRRVFGSNCRAIEAFMASVVAVASEGVNLGNTIEIKEIRIERNLRARRALVVEKSNECGFVDCHEDAVASGVWRDKRELLLCEKHLAEARSNPREWKVLALG